MGRLASNCRLAENNHWILPVQSKETREHFLQLEDQTQKHPAPELLPNKPLHEPGAEAPPGEHFIGQSACQLGSQPRWCHLLDERHFLCAQRLLHPVCASFDAGR